MFDRLEHRLEIKFSASVFKRYLTNGPGRIRTCNTQPSAVNAGYKPGVLPLNYGTEIFLMFAVGIEPTTYRLEVCCSIQMS